MRDDTRDRAMTQWIGSRHGQGKGHALFRCFGLKGYGETSPGGHVWKEDGWVWFSTHAVPILMPELCAGAAILECQ